MRHKGKLKYTTSLYLHDVEPFPRLKIMMLCDIAINLARKLPDSFAYKHLSFNYTKHIMKVVDENESVIDIESKISNISSAEDVIERMHNEVSLLQQFIRTRPWELIEEEKKTMDLKEFFFLGAGLNTLKGGNPIPRENAQHKKNERPERPKTAGNS